MKIFTRRNYLQVTAIIAGFGFVYTAFSAPPGSPYTPGETLAPTCAPGDANCTIEVPHYNGVSEAWIGATETASKTTYNKTERRFNVEATDTTTTTGWIPLSMVDAYIEPSGAQAAGAARAAFAGYSQISATNTQTIQRVEGISGGSENYGTGTISGGLYGIVGWGYNAANATANTVGGQWTGAQSDNGTVTHLIGSDVWSDVAGGAVTNSYGVNVVLENSGGTITNRYGLYIGAFTGAATNDYGIYQSTTTLDNYFAGDVGIGTISPAADLHISAPDENVAIFGPTTGAGTYDGNMLFYSGDTYPLIAFRAGTTKEAQIVGGVGGADQGKVYLDAPGDFVVRDTIDGGNILFEADDNGQFYINRSNLTYTDEELHIGEENGGSSDTAISIENGSIVYEIHVEDSDEFVIYDGQDENSGNSVLMYNGATQHWGFGTDPTANELQMDSGAHITAGGVFTDASSRAYKTRIESITLEEAKQALALLDPVRFQYKEQLGEEYLGFIAEDVPDLVATADRKGLSSMDIVAVLVKVNQRQQEEIAQLKQLVCLDHPSAELCQ